MHASVSRALLVAAAVITSAPVMQAQMQMSNPMVGGQAMMRSKDIVDNAVNSADHTTLVAAVKAAGLVETLKGPGPFTVFAPTNAAFAQLPAGTVETLVRPENKSTLTAILTYHVVSGRYDFAALRKLIMKGGGTATLATVNGAALTLRMNGDHNITVADTKGNVANISIYDVYQSNGVILVIDKVLMP
jgi:uncharacterized surface protein with fasciclin (FAS1) repeats